MIACIRANVLPIRARATVSFRVLPGETAAAVLANVRATNERIRAGHFARAARYYAHFIIDAEG